MQWVKHFLSHISEISVDNWRNTCLVSHKTSDLNMQCLRTYSSTGHITRQRHQIIETCAYLRARSYQKSNAKIYNSCNILWNILCRLPCSPLSTECKAGSSKLNKTISAAADIWRYIMCVCVCARILRILSLSLSLSLSLIYVEK